MGSIHCSDRTHESETMQQSMPMSDSSQPSSCQVVEARSVIPETSCKVWSHGTNVKPAAREQPDLFTHATL